MAERLAQNPRKKLREFLLANRIPFSRKREAEARTKVKRSEHQRLRGEFENGNAERVFEGRIVTDSFTASPEGMHVRIREIIPDGEMPAGFEWGIKFDSERTKGQGGLKIKEEFEPEGLLPSFEDARTQLASVLNALGLNVDLSQSQLKVGKRRVSFLVPTTTAEKKRGWSEPLKADLDTFEEVNGQNIKPIYSIETEDTSWRSKEIKLRRIRNLARRFGFKLKPKHSALSTRAFLMDQEVIRKQYVVRPGALAKK